MVLVLAVPVRSMPPRVPSRITKAAPVCFVKRRPSRMLGARAASRLSLAVALPCGGDPKMSKLAASSRRVSPLRRWVRASRAWAPGPRAYHREPMAGLWPWMRTATRLRIEVGSGKVEQVAVLDDPEVRLSERRQINQLLESSKATAGGL